MTRDEITREIISIMCDGSRADRYLKSDAPGTYYATTHRHYDGVYGSGYRYTPAVAIPFVCGGATDDEIAESAAMLVDELDSVLAVSRAEADEARMAADAADLYLFSQPPEA
jgi:hypothetical protein